MTDTLAHNATGDNVTSYTSKTTTINQDDLMASVYEPRLSENASSENASSDGKTGCPEGERGEKGEAGLGNDSSTKKDPLNLSMMIDVMESKLKQTDENDINYSTMQQMLQNTLNMQAEMQANSKNPLTEPLPQSSSEEEQVDSGIPLSEKENCTLKQVNDSLTEADDPYRLDKMAFARLRPSLQPPLKPGERVVICDGEFKGRFDSMPECARFILYELKRNCYVHREPAEDKPRDSSIYGSIKL